MPSGTGRRRHNPGEFKFTTMPSLLRLLAVVCLVSFACIGLLMQSGLPLDLGTSELFFGIAALLGLLLWLTESDLNRRD